MLILHDQDESCKINMILQWEVIFCNCFWEEKQFFASLFSAKNYHILFGMVTMFNLIPNMEFPDFFLQISSLKFKPLQQPLAVKDEFGKNRLLF